MCEVEDLPIVSVVVPFLFNQFLATRYPPKKEL